MSSIVWLASYPKSGNTWMRAFIQNYLENGKQASDINQLDRLFASENKPSWYQPYLNRPHMDLGSEDVCKLRPQVHLDIANSKAGSILVKTHNFHGEYMGYPLHNMSVTAGVIYILRNPLDVVLSVADHFGLELDDAITFLNAEETGTPADEANMGSVLSSWSNHVRSWTHAESDATCVIRFEDLKLDPLSTFENVLSFLNIPEDSARLEKAIQHSSFDKLRQQEQASGFTERSPNSDRFFRHGTSGQWQTELSEEQIASIVAVHAEQMERFDYLPDKLP